MHRISHCIQLSVSLKNNILQLKGTSCWYGCPYLLVSHFRALQSGADRSTLAFSPCIFDVPAFSTPSFSVPQFNKIYH